MKDNLEKVLERDANLSGLENRAGIIYSRKIIIGKFYFLFFL